MRFSLLAPVVLVGSLLVPAPAHALTSERVHQTVPGRGTFYTCADGRVITYASVSERDVTRWYADTDGDGAEDDLVRERRHLTFTGTLTSDGVAVPYSGVWNRDSDLTTGVTRITGGNFQVDLRVGRTLMGAGLRDLDTAYANGFVGSGERWLEQLCAWYAG